MSTPWYPNKYFSSDDNTLTGEIYSETQGLISDKRSSSEDFLSSTRNTTDARDKSRLLIPDDDVSQCLEADSGLYSKFKNTRIADYSIYESRGPEEKHSYNSNSGLLGIGISTVEEISVTRETDRGNDVKKGYNMGFNLAILLTVFTTEFAGALEIVYITPYFLKVRLNEWIDATIWIIPLLFVTLLKAPISILAGHRNYQRPLLFTLMWMFIIGCFIFTYVDEFPISQNIRSAEKTVMTWLGLVAFCFIDIANEMIAIVQYKVVEEHSEISDSLNSKISATGSVAKILGYLCGSLQALRMSYSEALETNMDACLLSAGGLMFLSMCLCYNFQTRSVKGYQGSLIPKFKNLKLAHFIPPLKRVWSSSQKMKFILLSHFFAAGSIVMLSVYATSWVAQDVLKGNPVAKPPSMTGHLFEVGVSWGSLGMMFTSIVILLMSFTLHKMLGNPHKTKFKMLHLFSQLLSSLALFACILLADLSSVFLVIPLTGFAFQTFHAVPEILAEILETEEGIVMPGSYRRLLDSSFFYAQVVMWLIVPLIFVFFPNRDDNQWGMLTAASSGLVSVLFTLFI